MKLTIYARTQLGKYSSSRLPKIWLRVIFTDVSNFAGFEIFAAVIMDNYIFQEITKCSPFKVNRRFGGKLFLLPALCRLLVWLILQPGRRRWHFHPKCLLTFNERRRFIAQNVQVFIISSVKRDSRCSQQWTLAHGSPGYDTAPIGNALGQHSGGTAADLGGHKFQSNKALRPSIRRCRNSTFLPSLYSPSI
jgi:hypothetical protein